MDLTSATVRAGHAESPPITAEATSYAVFRPQADPITRCASNDQSSNPQYFFPPHRSASSSSERHIIGASSAIPSTKSVPRFASLIAMDGKTAPPTTSANTVSNHEHSKASESATQLMAPSFSQPSLSESRENGHVRQPSSPSRTQIQSQAQSGRGHKRTATGDVKLPGPGVQIQSQANGTTGHSRTKSLDSTGSKIAELSAQLRARLSYAAAKVEKDWQVRQAGHASAQSLKLDTAQNSKESVPGSRQSYDGSPDGTITSAPETLPSQASNTINGTSNRARASMPPQIATSLHIPKLAPPVDLIAANKAQSTRRRPNPNEANSTRNYNPYPRHRRHHSELEGHAARPYNSNRTSLSGTPPFGASTLRMNGHTGSPMRLSNKSPIKRRTPSQNALMEQDAIETLLFMSSPENSGYHANSQPRKTNVSMSIEAQIEAGFNGGTQNSSQASNISNLGNTAAVDFFRSGALHANLPASIANNHSIGLEAQAGDEIDRLLDQMENENRNNAQAQLSSYDFSSLDNQELGFYGVDCID